MGGNGIGTNGESLSLRPIVNLGADINVERCSGVNNVENPHNFYLFLSAFQHLIKYAFLLMAYLFNNLRDKTITKNFAKSYSVITKLVIIS